MGWRGFLFLIPPLILSGCTGGEVRDKALISQAERALTAIRNSLEEYHLDHGSYPGEGADLKALLTPYFLRVVFREGEEIARHVVTVTFAKNKLTQAKELLTEYDTHITIAVKDTVVRSQLQGELATIEEAAAGYSAELEGESAGTAVHYPEEAFRRLRQLIEDLDLERLHSSFNDSIVLYGDSTISELRGLVGVMEESVEDTSRREELKGYVMAADSSWQEYREKLLKRQERGESQFSPGAQIDAIRSILPESDTLLPRVENMALNYWRALQQRKAVSDLSGAEWKRKRANDLLREYEYKLKDKAKRALAIVKAQGELKAMAQAIEAYRGAKGNYPEDGVNLERFFLGDFAQLMPEETKKNPYTLDHLLGPPTYSTRDPTKNCRLDAVAKDVQKTAVFCEVRMVNEWDKTVSTFSQGPVYATMDSTIAYFMRVKANDYNKTPLATRPAVVREKEKKKQGRRR